ncbi:hypothetical protein [Puia dinghuensis]|uniref:PNPLA domain-containing protein n=1 Tax=Puia dinghuensis TaxID=1792502 RepID=A0A8J2XWD6_9BACT|nr:hypothetical protein [Puia dinghuensis]GGB22942.1 hypothetical protein GCM10011511_53580 [Puia dinghuensis]
MAITNLSPRDRIEQVALTFSGGGFRAAGFALGCLSYMEVLPLENGEVAPGGAAASSMAEAGGSAGASVGAPRGKEQPFAASVGFIASASGGTITNLVYTVAQRKGQPFLTVYKMMHEEMLMGTKIVDEVFRIIGEKDCWTNREQKSRNLINAFSLAYDRLLFDHETFGVLMRPAPEDRKVVEGVCVNTTEFRNGMLFRFQNEGVAGNAFLRFRKKAGALDHIRLGDILAASSCFPVGFEPMMFPRDFTHAGLSAEVLQEAMLVRNRRGRGKAEDGEAGDAVAGAGVRGAADAAPGVAGAEDDAVGAGDGDGADSGKVGATAATDSGAGAEAADAAGGLCFAFMDGGIDDNQGIDSLMRAEERMQRRNGFGYDLFLCCDVSSNYTDGYDFPQENMKSWWQKGSMGGYAAAMVLLLVLSLLGIFYRIVPGLAYALLGISGLLTAAMVAVVVTALRAHGKAKARSNTFGIILFQHITIFLRLRLSVILQMINSRASSAGYLAAVVFLKKIRRISYDRLFNNISELKLAGGDTGLKHWSDFALQNAIYLLSTRNDSQRHTDLRNEPWFAADPTIILGDKAIALDDLMEPGAAVQEVADIATEMETTLWFDKDQIAAGRPAALIATGQLTTCYNLLRWAFRFDRKDAYWQALQDRLVADWMKFKADPYWLYDQYGATACIEGFREMHV